MAEALDGVIADDLDPFDFTDDGAREVNEHRAVALVTAALSTRYRRPLNASDAGKVRDAVTREWSTYAERAKEVAFDRSEGELWRHAETPFARNH